MNLTVYITLFSLVIFVSIDALPMRILEKVRVKGYILVAPEIKQQSTESNSKSPQLQAGANGGKCAFDLVADTETSRIPKHLNVAELKDSTNEKDCIKLTYEFTVLKQCDDCDQRDNFGIIYKLSKQTKVVGFTEKVV